MSLHKWKIEDTEQQQKKLAKKIRGIITSLFVIGGVIVLVSQLGPLALSYASGYIMTNSTQELVAPFPDSYKNFIEGEFAFWDPGQTYFENMFEYVQNNDFTTTQVKIDTTTKKVIPVTVDTEYSRPMKISIPAIGINNINIEPNVESYDKNVYNLSLKSGVAHFKGTPLPGDGGNSFIYGHSAVPTFFNRHKDLPETIFTHLQDAEIGNRITIEKDGAILRYRVIKKKIVEANDYSIFNQIGNKETVTLMTCWPIGIGTKRLIVIGEKYE